VVGRQSVDVSRSYCATKGRLHVKDDNRVRRFGARYRWFVAWKAGLPTTAKEWVDLGTFVVLSLTLIAVIQYGYDTNQMTRITIERWQRDSVLATAYEMQLAQASQKGDAGRTMFTLINHSTLVVRAKANMNLRVYGQAVQAGDPYDGKAVWMLYPLQSSSGWFEIQSLLKQQGKTVEQMIAEYADNNQAKQLTMLLELEFWDELGARRTLPPREHYFDFNRWKWIPHLVERK
jgi:hypothetical protein